MRSRARAISASGDFTSQSRSGSDSGDLSVRCGARVHETNEAPVASTSGRLHGSPMRRTVCPRATSRRMTARTGGVLPPPSQCAKRKERVPPTYALIVDPLDPDRQTGEGRVARQRIDGLAVGDVVDAGARGTLGDAQADPVAVVSPSVRQ